jgi:Na+:H+ antiporter, NhaA family
MTHHVLTHDAPVLAGSRRGAARAYRYMLDHFLLLPVGAALALVWANTAAESYFRFAHALAFAVNEIGMALFFALVMQEVVEETVPGGALHTWRRWALPIVGALGATAAAAGVYLGYVYSRYEEVLAPGWPVACAVDVAFAYFLVKAIFGRSTAVPFLLALVIAANAFGVLALAVLYPTGPVHPGAAAAMAIAIGLAAWFHRAKVRSFWPYLLVCGTLAWWACRWSGIHPALALVPIVPFMTHAARTQVFVDAPHSAHDSPTHFEHVWGHPVQGILLLFGLVNGGAILNQFDTGTWAVIAAALIGRPLGIIAAVAVAVAVGFHLPARLRWRDLFVIAGIASCGFTFALFFATAVYPVGAALTQIKIGALATIAGAILALVAARVLHAGRFSHHEVSPAHGHHHAHGHAHAAAHHG